ncbi:probable asparagine--tRNA ligase, mitochondrial [Ischnura elegans]|uniref:probable asparagine--tRNA ligase, mitochondrial n=1 Tax=Ischnura elegans TaxID=197161 RepID=UPI001ED8A5AB|nr:probable asparagine--tRNA ligase, mitochondrial [Ischnura elegans]
MRKLSSLWGSIPFRCFFTSHQHFSSNISIHEALNHKRAGEKVIVKGWVKGVRVMKNNLFFDVSDGSSVGKLQVVLPHLDKLTGLSFGSSVEVEGIMSMNPRDNSKSELIANKVDIIGPCDVQKGYPFAPRKAYSGDYTRQFLHMRPRTATFASLLRIRNAASLAVHTYMNSKGFILIHAPIITSNDCEGAGEVFKVAPHSELLVKEMLKDGCPKDQAYFDSKAFLTVSGQLHAECVARGITKVYTFGPTFRAENSRSRLHLSEFYMIEPEIAFVDNLEDILTFMEEFVKNIVSTLLTTAGEDIEFLYRNQNMKSTEHLCNILDRPFCVVTYDEAFDVLTKNSHKLKTPPRKVDGLNKEQELFLVSHNGGCPVFVINWPKEMKPFYMRELVGDSSMVSAVDLLVPRVGELCGGSLRETDPDIIAERLKLLHLEEPLQWYIDLRRFGNVPTGGFGMGFERFLQMLLPIENIKDVIPFPRWPHNCKM